MRGFMQASGLIEVKSPVVEKPKQGKGVNRETGKPHWMTCREKAIKKLTDALRLVPKEFTSQDLNLLSGSKGNAMFFHITQLADLDLVVRVGKRAHFPLFKLNCEIDRITAVLMEKGIRTSGVSKSERKEIRNKQIRTDMVNFLKQVPEVFTTNQLRDAIDCYASVVCGRINIMLREGLIEPFEPEKWRARYPRTYKKVGEKMLSEKVKKAIEYAKNGDPWRDVLDNSDVAELLISLDA